MSEIEPEPQKKPIIPETGRVANFAEGSDSESKERLKKRLTQSRVPSSQDSTQAWINWSNMESVLGQPFDSTRIPLAKLENMRRDPMLSFGLNFVKVPLVRAPWYIKSTDAQRAAFVDNALRRIYGRLILAYTNSFDFGYSAIVKRFEYIKPDWTYLDKGPDGGSEPQEKPVWPNENVNAVTWKPFLPLNPRNVAPHWNASGEFAGIDFAPPGGVSAFGYSGYSPIPGIPGSRGTKKVADIPMDWALWATNEKDSVFGNLYGYPRIGYAYRYWWSYWYKFALADRAFEKWSDPPMVVFHPAETGLDANGERVDFGDTALSIGEQARSGSNISMPSSVVRGLDERTTSVREWEIQQLKSEVNFDALNQTFEYLDVQKLRSVMVPEQALVEGKGGSSSRNVAETFGDVFAASQAIVMTEIDDMINRYMIPQLLEANFGPGGASCTKVTNGFDPQDIATMSAIVQAVAQAGTLNELPVDMRQVLERLGIPMLSHAEFQQEMERRADEAAEALPPEVKPQGGPSGRTAGVTKKGLYYNAEGEKIELSDEETGTVKRFYNFLFGKPEANEDGE